MSKQTMVTIDPEKMRSFVTEKGVYEVTKMLGKAPTYFHNICIRSKMPLNVLQALCAIYGKKPEDFKPAEPDIIIEEPRAITGTGQQTIRGVLDDFANSGKAVPMPVPSPMPSKGYALDLQVYPDFVHLRLVEDSKVIKQAKGKIKKEGAEATKLEIVQAISYAAHLIYKFAEQDEIG